MQISYSCINLVNRRQTSSINKIEPIVFKGNLSQESKYIGCIIGGAIGDAMGAPVEFLSDSQIRKLYGEQGILAPMIGMSGEADYSDDTQMLIFTIDGILKSINMSFDSNKPPQIEDMHKSYLDWYKTQTEDFSKRNKASGWIVNHYDLYQRKSPGHTCLSALETGKIGTIENPINNSKGNGGVMRVAPIGLLYNKNPELAFKIGMQNAAITHGHPSGYLSAGFLSSLITRLVNNQDIKTAILKTIETLEKYPNNQEVKEKILLACKLADSEISEKSCIEILGQGWVAEEAIAIALCCALRHLDDYVKALRMAVNHSGDSDTVGAITGNIIGTMLGEDSIPDNWKKIVQDKKFLTKLAIDLIDVSKNPQEHKDRYPYNCGRVPNWHVESFLCH